MGKFGWSYPPGCSGPPDDDVGISKLQEAVLDLLEEAEIDTDTNDKICKLIETAEIRRAEVRSEATAPRLTSPQKRELTKIVEYPDGIGEGRGANLRVRRKLEDMCLVELRRMEQKKIGSHIVQHVHWRWFVTSAGRAALAGPSEETKS